VRSVSAHLLVPMKMLSTSWKLSQDLLRSIASRLERLHDTTSILSRQLTRSMSSHKLSRYRIHFATLLFEEYDSYLRQNLFLVLYLF
jgi:hypothetical protein